MPYTVLVTGATGFVGRPVVESLLDAGHTVYAVARDPRGGGGERGLIVVDWDLRDPRKPRERVGGVEVVVHLAARIPGPAGPDRGPFADNVSMIGNLVDGLDGVRHMIFASTIDVYGRPRAVPFREDHPPQPATAYARSKLQSEERLQALGRARGFTLTVLRLSQVYGPGDRSAKVIPRMIDALLSGHPPVLYGDGSDLRDYAYVDDVVDAIRLAVEQWHRGIFNISSGAPATIARVAEILMAIDNTSGPAIRADRRGEKLDLVMDISKARDVLGYRPRVTLAEGLRRQLDWARSKRC